jgi:hypothetical protein
MAGIAAGVVTESQVNGMPSAPSKFQLSLSQPATWAFIWTASAFAYLIGIYLGFITINRRES